MTWVQEFYGTTGRWWGRAEARITARDHRRVEILERYGGPSPRRVLELGSGYGTTAVASALAGYDVTAVELTERAEHLARVLAAVGAAPDLLAHHRADFYAVELSGRFDVVTYWNGFGIGDDADQRRLLRRIRHDWLTDNGIALIDVFNPFAWARWHNDEEHLGADSDRGYEHELRERTTFDPVSCRATDTWWDVAVPERRLSQHLRCYTPADLRLLVEGTGLRLTQVVVGDEMVGIEETPSAAVVEALLGGDGYEYLAVLAPRLDEGTLYLG